MFVVIELARSLGIRELGANITKGNMASVRVIEKCDFVFNSEQHDSVSINGKRYSNLEYRRKLD